MALIICPECEKEISDKAKICVNCGFPIEKYLKQQEKAAKKIKTEFTDEELSAALKSKNKKAEEYINDPDKFDKFIEKLEKKIKKIPKVGEYATDIAWMISLVRSYIRKEYTEIPLGSIIGIMSALVYLFSPIDLIPDATPVVGYADDVAVLLFALKMVHSDIEDYKEWKNNKKPTPESEEKQANEEKSDASE